MKDLVVPASFIGLLIGWALGAALATGICLTIFVSADWSVLIPFSAFLTFAASLFVWYGE